MASAAAPLTKLPENPVGLAGWHLAPLGRTLDVLGAAHPDSETWTFSSTSKLRLVGKYRMTGART